MHELGKSAPNSPIYFTFTTVNPTTGAPASLSGGALAVYKDGNTTEVTTGLTLTADYDSRTGLNHVAIVTTDAFYAADSAYSIVFTAGTVSGVSVANVTLARFRIEETDLTQLNADADYIALKSTVTGLSASLVIIDSKTDDAKAASESADTKLSTARLAKVDNLLASGTYATDADVAAAGGGGTVLQYNIDPGFTFELPSRKSSITTARPIYLSSIAERPRFAFDVSKVAESRPSSITAVAILDSEGETSAALTVADQDDTTNAGVRDWLVISKVTGASASGTYTVRVTFTALDTSVYVVEGQVVVP